MSAGADPWYADPAVAAPGYTMPERMTRVETTTVQLTSATASNTSAISDLGRAMRGRPSWPVAFALAFLSTTNGVLLTLALNGQA